MDFTKQSQTILSLCPGMLGLERGLERVGINFRVAAYVEIEAFIIENLVKQMEQGVLAPAPIFSDVKTFNAEPFRNKIHGIIGGYPCQPFSCAGKQGGKNDPRHLWSYIKEHIRAIKPVWCFFENVRNHINIGYREVRSDLEELGYKVEEGIFSAEEVGAPHRRERLFILAIQKEYVAYMQDSRIGGLSECEQRQEWGKSVKSANLNGGGEELANSYFNGFRRFNKGGFQSEIIGSSEMGNPSQPNKQRDGIFEELQEGSIRGSGCEMANSNNKRLQGWDSEELPECSNKCTARTIGAWPSKPGEDQYEWEQPRTESKLGYTVNGYNYREDLLRMAGNSVVEQTAELALKTLLNKFQL